MRAAGFFKAAAYRQLPGCIGVEIRDHRMIRFARSDTKGYPNFMGRDSGSMALPLGTVPCTQCCAQRSRTDLSALEGTRLDQHCKVSPSCCWRYPRSEGTGTLDAQLTGLLWPCTQVRPSWEARCASLTEGLSTCRGVLALHCIRLCKYLHSRVPAAPLIGSYTCMWPMRQRDCRQGTPSKNAASGPQIHIAVRSVGSRLRHMSALCKTCPEHVGPHPCNCNFDPCSLPRQRIQHPIDAKSPGRGNRHSACATGPCNASWPLFFLHGLSTAL